MHEDRWMDRNINLSRYEKRFAYRRVKCHKPQLGHLTMVSRSMFSSCAVTSGFSTIRYKLVPSAKNRIFAWISLTISLIKSKNNNGPNIEP